MSWESLEEFSNWQIEDLIYANLQGIFCMQIIQTCLFIKLGFIFSVFFYIFYYVYEKWAFIQYILKVIIFQWIERSFLILNVYRKYQRYHEKIKKANINDQSSKHFKLLKNLNYDFFQFWVKKSLLEAFDARVGCHYSFFSVLFLRQCQA